MAYSTLVIDDSAYSRATISGYLTDAGYDVIGVAKNGEEALDQIDMLHPDIITLDNILPDMTGLQILSALKDQGGDYNILMISAVGQQSVIEEALELGASGYLIKPFTKDQLLEHLEDIMARVEQNLNGK